jgi:hypothetical protein
MILDMNIKLDGIDKEFLEDLDELIEDTRVEYFIINPNTKEELAKTQSICEEIERFKYTLPIEFLDIQDENCIALKIKDEKDLQISTDLPFVIKSEYLNDSFIDTLNTANIKGVILNAKEKDNTLQNFAFSISQSSLKNWSQLGIKNTDYNKLALQSDYPEQSYDDFLDVMLKEISDLTFRAEQTIAAGGTRTLLKTFKLL